VQKWSELSFAELSLEIMSLYVSEDEIPRAGKWKREKKGREEEEEEDREKERSKR
jgi:hypothetical protein